MADRNLKDYNQTVRDSNGRAVADALRSVGGATRPTDADLAAGTLFWNTGSTALDLYNGTSWLTVATGAGAGTPTWDDIYTNDKTLNINDTTLTITVSANVAGLTFNETAAGAGAVMAITNSGTGNDITGNAGNWSVTAAGALTVASVTSTGAITCTAISDNAAGATLQVDGNAGGGVNIGSTSTGAITLGRATTITTGGLTVTDTGITVSDGITDLIDNSNTTPGLRLTNDTVTTYGSGGVSTGVALFRSTSLTTGSLVSLQLTEGALAGGFYLRCFDVTAGADVFTLGEDGAVVITGVGGSNVTTLTAGDMVLSDGSVTITDADNANSLSVTNNTAITASVVEIAGSGVFTGTTTSSFMEVNASGLTTGTLLRLVANAATTSVGVVDISTTGLTSGSSLRITEATANFTTGARAIEVNLVAATAGNGLTIDTTGAYTGTGLITATAGAMTTGVLVSLTSTTGLTSGSLLRMTTSTAGAVATNGICSIRATGAYTSTSNAGLLDVVASALVGTGTIVNIQATNGSQLTNTALNIEQTTTTVGYTGDFVRIVGTSTTGDCNLIAVTSASTSAGDALQITNNGLVAGTSTIINLIHGTSVLGAGNSMLRITSTGADTGTTTGCLVDLASSTATAGTLVLLTSATLATGSGIVAALAGLTTGVGFSMTHATAVIASGGSMFRLNSGGIDTATTTGCLVDLTSTASLAGTQVLMTFSGLTTGIGMRMVGNAITSGIMVDLETSAAGFTGTYIRCFDGAAVDFSIAADGAIVQTSGLNTTVYALTADTASTLGAAANDGVVNLSADGLTTGTALNIGLTEATLTTGRYLKCWDVTGAVEVAAIEEDGELFVAGGRATTAGGADAINIGSSAAIKVAWGSGAPTYTAPQGSIYLRTDGSSTSTRLYVNSDGAGTWVAVTTAS